MPLALKKEHKGSDNKITEAGWEEFAVRVRERMEDPYLVPEFPTLPTIPVDWVREVTHAIRRGAVEKGKNIVIIDGVDIMLQESANAMLKTLEEPPPDTLLLLCTERPHVVLPTIASRCQLLRFAGLRPDTLRSELVARYGIRNDDPRLDAVQHVGSLGRARLLLQHFDIAEERDANEFWRLIVGRDRLAVFQKIDALTEAADYRSYENLFIQLLYGIRNAFFTNIEGTENYIIGDSSLTGSLPELTTLAGAELFRGYCEKAINRIKARANAALVLADFALSVMERLNE